MVLWTDFKRFFRKILVLDCVSVCVSCHMWRINFLAWVLLLCVVAALCMCCLVFILIM